MSMESSKVIGYVLSGSTTSVLKIQLNGEGERVAREGMIVAARDPEGFLVLARLDSIKPFDAVYAEGSGWSELIKHGSVPQGLSTVHVVAEATVLGSSTALGEGLSEPPRPPWPGSEVTLVSRSELEALLGFSRDRPGVVWFGRLLGYEDAVGVPLNVENLTMHLGVFGETGSGKSYGVGYLIELLSRIPLGGGEYGAFPAIVVDANGDYLDYHDGYSRGEAIGEYSEVVRLVFPRSNARYLSYTREVSISLDFFTARELSEFTIAYRSGGFEINELQVSLLERALKEFEGIYGFTELISSRLGELYETIDGLTKGPGAVFHHQTGRAVKSALEKLHRDLVIEHQLLSQSPRLDERFIDTITRNPSLVIVDFSAEGAPGVALPLKQLIIAYIARLLYKEFTRFKVTGDERYIALVLEEAQNYVPNPRNYPVAWSIARDYLSLIATQGRKFGICLVLVSQRPSFIDPVVVSMLNTFMIYRSPPDDVAFISKAVGGLPPQLREKLTRLPRGTLLIAGQMNMLGFPVMALAGERRVSHRMGKTRVVEALRRAKKRAKERISIGAR